MRPVVLTIAGSDSGGGAGIQGDLETITLLGAHGVSVITALTAQNTQGVKAVEAVRPEFVREQLEAVLEDFKPKAAKTGMLWGREVIEMVAEVIEGRGIEHLVVDPVLVAKGGERLLEEGALQALKKRLFPLATVITPNVPEAEALTGLPIRDREGMVEVGRKLLGYGPGAVLLKGGHYPGDPWDLLIWPEGHKWIKGDRYPGEPHGTGCALSAALATYLALGYPLEEAAERAKAFVREGIAHAKTPGKGRPVVDPFWMTEREAERWEVVRRLREAYLLLERDLPGDLIPEVGSNLVYALRGARGPEDVAGVEGRIVKVGKGIRKVGDITFGASRHMASVVLEVMKFDPSYRSAMNLRYGPEVLRAADRLGLKVLGFDRGEESPEVRFTEGASLPWGVRRVLEVSPEVPDIIFDPGGWGKEAMVRVLGRGPEEVAEKVLRVAREL